MPPALCRSRSCVGTSRLPDPPRRGGGRSDRLEEAGVQDREDVVALHRSDDVLGASHHLGESLEHVSARHGGVVLETGRGERRHHGRAGDIRGRCAQLLDDGECGSGEVPVAGPHRQRLVQVLQSLIQQDETRRGVFEQPDNLRCRGSEQRFVLAADLSVHGSAAEPPRQMTEVRVHRCAVVHLFRGDAESRTVEHRYPRRRQVPRLECAGDLLAERCGRDTGRVSEEVIGGQEGMGLAAAELGLHAVHRSGGGVAAETVADLDQRGLQWRGHIGLACEEFGIAVVRRSSPERDEAQVRGEEGLVEGAVSYVGVRAGHFEPGSQVGHGTGAFLMV